MNFLRNTLETSNLLFLKNRGVVLMMTEIKPFNPQSKYWIEERIKEKSSKSNS